MKIIVSCEKEKELIEKFLEIFRDIEAIEMLEDEEKRNSPEDKILSHNEYKFIGNGFDNCKVEVGETDYLKANSEIITGTCSKCGQTTEGLYDEDYVAYGEFLEYMSPASQSEWICCKCMDEME